MDFYHMPGSSSLATHIMLCEVGMYYKAIKVDIATHSLEDGSDYLGINPNGTGTLLGHGYTVGMTSCLIASQGQISIGVER